MFKSSYLSIECERQIFSNENQIDTLASAAETINYFMYRILLRNQQNVIYHQIA